MPLAAPAGQRRPWWPLAVSLAAHALLAGLWLRHVTPLPVAPDTPEPLSVLVLPAARAPVLPPPPRARHDEKARRAPRPPATRVPTVPAPPSPPQPVAPAGLAQPDPPRPSAADILESARHQIGQIERETRAGKPGAVMRPADSAWDRFGQRVADAWVERGAAPSSEAYTSPDGTTYYRTRVGNKYYCRKTGTLDPSSTWKTGREMHANSMSTLGMSGTSGLVLCPGSERDWQRR